MPEKREPAVVCLSGGMDSCVCAALAARDYSAYALHCGYGQRTEERELLSARAVAEKLGFSDFLHLRLEIFRRIGGSALTDERIDVPEAAGGIEESASGRTGAEIPVTY